MTGAAKRAMQGGAVANPSMWRHLVHMATLCLHGIKRSQLTRMAAALSYRTLFGLVPVLVVGLVFTATFAPREKVSGWLESLLKYAGISQIAVVQAVDIGPPNPMASSPRLDEWIQGMVDHVRGLKWEVVGFVGLATLIYAAISMLVEIEEAFNQIYHAPSGRSWTRRVTQYWTLLTLGSLFLVGSFSLPAQLESKVNQVLSYARGVVGYETGDPKPTPDPEAPAGVSSGVKTEVKTEVKTDVKTGGKADVTAEEKSVEKIGVATIFAAKIAAAAGDAIIEKPKEGSEGSSGGVAGTDVAAAQQADAAAPRAAKTVTGVLIGAAFSLMVSFVLFLTIYSVVPNTRVQIAAASVGASVTALLWELAKQAFALYVSSSSGYTTFYGALALLPMFLIWVYLTWLIVLFGLHVAFALQSYRAAARQGLTQPVLVALGLIEETQGKVKPLRTLDPGAMVVVLSVVGERFAAGQPTESADVVERTGLDETAIMQMLEKLADGGILHRVKVDNGLSESGYVLSRPPSSIALVDVISLTQEPTDQVKSPSGARMLETLARARTEALANRTLADALV